MMSFHGLNALQIILASGFSGVTELGCIPDSVVALAELSEPVRLVRANESVNFHLAAKSNESIRGDTAIYRWLADVARSVVETPDYYLVGSRPRTFQLLKRVVPPAKYPELEFLRLPIKFVPSANAASGAPELWLSTAIFHDASNVIPFQRRAVHIGV
jgi:hypothetical protein